MIRDPMLKATPTNERELFELLSGAAAGASSAQVINAAANLIINALRQANPSREAAERAFDEIFGRAKQILSDHYDSVGRKRGVFPFDQTISVRLFGNESKFPRQ